MKITLSQLNVMVGDILSNKSKNIDYIDEAAQDGRLRVSGVTRRNGPVCCGKGVRCRWPMMYTEIKNHLNNKYYDNTQI